MVSIKDFKQISPYIWEIPKAYRYDMRAPARIYISREMLMPVLEEKAVEQLINVASLPGVEGPVLAMPDIHEGYGFPIGGVAAIRAADGVISPGGVGYDINCGVRLLLSPFTAGEIKDKVTALANQMQRDVPSGVGRGGEMVLDNKELDKVLNTGLDWAVKNGYAEEEDLEMIEERGSFSAADAACVSARAKKRGADQLGTLGAGNHFLEIQEIERIFNKDLADKFGMRLGQVAVMIHTGSRGLGHQICTDFVSLMNRAMIKYNIKLPDRELACAPFQSEEGQKYFKAMAAAANYAWANRQMITYNVRGAWQYALGKKIELPILYDVAHNIAKVEKYNGREYIVHRKGATRAFGPHSPELPEIYKETGQPVIIPGSMGTASYVLVGTETAMQETFGSTCHGAGRQMSRMAAKRKLDYNQLIKMLEVKGIVVRGGSARGIIEEAPEAYKNIDDVAQVVHAAGIAKKVAKLKPLAVIKG